jgi:hypothetical protein
MWSGSESQLLARIIGTARIIGIIGTVTYFLRRYGGMVESDIAVSLSRAYNQDIGQLGMEFRTLPYCDRPGHERTKTTEIGDCPH